MQKIREIQEESLAQTLRRIWKAALTSILTSFAVLGIFGFLFTGMFTLFTWFAASTVLSVAWVFNQVIGLRATQMSKAVGEKYQAVRQRAVRQIRDWQKEVNDHILKEAKAAVANGLKVAAAPFKEVAEHVQKNRSRYAFGLVLTAGIILVIALRSRIKRVVQRFMSKAKAEGKHTVDKQGIVDGILTVLTTSTLVVGAIGVIVDMTTMKKVVEALRHMHAVKAAVIACSGVIAFLSKSSLALLDLFGLTSLFQVEKIAEKVKNGSKSLDHMCDFDILEPADVRFFADALEADQVPNPDKKKELLKKLAEKRVEKNLEKWEFDRDACEYVPACIFDYEKYGTYGFIDDPKDGVVYKVHESTPTYLSDEGDHVRHLTPGLWKYHKSTHDFVRIGDSDDDEFDTVAVPWRKCLIREVPDKLVIKKPLPFSFSEDGEVFSEPTINMMRADIFVKFEVESERRKARKVAAEIRKINARIEGKDEKLEKEKEKEKEKEMEDIHLDQVGHKTELDYNHYVKWIALVLLVLALSIGAYYVYNYIWKEEQLEQGEKKIPALGAKKVEETPAAQPQPARAFDGNKRGQDYWKKRHAAKAECIHMPDCPKKMGVVSDKDCNTVCGGHHCTHFLTCNPHNNKEIAALATKTIPEGGNSYQKLTGCQAPEAEGVIRGKNKRRGKHRKMMSDADYLEWKRQQRQQELQRIREADYDLGEDFGNDYEGGYFGGSWGEYMDDYEDYHRQARAEGIEEFPDFVPYDDHYQDLCAYLKDEDEWVLVAPESRFHAMYPKFTDWLKRKKDTVQGWFQKTQEQPTEKTVEEIKNKPAQESKQKNKPLQKVAEGPSKNANKQQQKQKQANEPKERGKKVTFQESSKPSRDFSKIPCNNSSCKGTFKMQLFDEKRRPRKGPGGNPLFTEIPCKYNHDHLKKEKGKEKEQEKPRPESRIATSLICPTNISEDKHAIVKINEKDQEWIKNGNAFGLQGGLFSLKHVGYKNPVVLEQWARNGAEKEVEETVTFKEYTKASWGSERIIWAPKTQSYNKYKFGIPQEGEECWVVGWDVTNPNQPVFVRTSGHVHGPRDEYKFTLGPDHMTHTCTTKFGMSACPVLNHKGEVIGLHWGGTGDSAAYNAFIPFTKQMVADFGSGGHSMTPY